MKDFIEKATRTEAPPENAIGRTQWRGLIRLLHAGIGIATEAGEFLDQLKKHVFYGKDLDFTNLKEEIGDMLWYLAIALDELGFTFEEVMSMVIEKLKKRYPEKFTEAEALNRDLETERLVLEQVSLVGENPLSKSVIGYDNARFEQNDILDQFVVCTIVSAEHPVLLPIDSSRKILVLILEGDHEFNQCSRTAAKKFAHDAYYKSNEMKQIGTKISQVVQQIEDKIRSEKGRKLT